MRSLDTQFREELDRFEADFWMVAGLVGYAKSDENFVSLISVFLPKFYAEIPPDLLEIFTPRIGTRLEEALGKCAYAFAIARKDESFNLTFLSSARESLGQAMVLVEFEKSFIDVDSLIAVRESLNEYFRAKVLSEFARKGAAAAHVETNKLKREVIEYWKEKIDSSLSNEKAATELLKQFPLAHRTLRDYVAEAKKELRFAGKA